MANFRNGIAAACLLTGGFIVGAADYAEARDYKSARDCNEEAAAKADKIKAAGESLSQFIHDCWWVSVPGQETAIRDATKEPSPTVADHRDVRPSDSEVPVATRDRPLQRVARTVGPETRRHAWSPAHWAHWSSQRRVARRWMPEAGFANTSMSPTPASHRFASSAWASRNLARRNAETLRAASSRQARLAAQRWMLADRTDGPAMDRPPKTRGVWRVSMSRPTPGKMRVAHAITRQRPPDTRLGAVLPSAIWGTNIWVRGVRNAAWAATPEKAVLINAATPPSRDRHRVALNCWSQPVLFQHGNRSRWSQSLVCDTNIASASASQVFFEGAVHRHRS